MDWALAIDRNRLALGGVVAALFALAGLAAADGTDTDADTAPATLPRRVHRAILRLLRPAESAVRRLIVVAASRMPPAPVPRPSGPRPSRPTGRVLRPVRAQAPAPAGHAPTSSAARLEKKLPLFDARRRVRRTRIAGRDGPRITWLVPGAAGRERHAAPAPEDPIPTTALLRRLRAVSAALADLDGEAARLARWRTRLSLRVPAGGQPAQQNPAGWQPGQPPAPRHRFRRTYPLRPGRPPGSRRRAIHAVDGLLRECHGLAVHAWDTWEARATREAPQPIPPPA